MSSEQNRMRVKSTIKTKGETLLTSRVASYWKRWMALFPDLYQEATEIEEHSKRIITLLWSSSIRSILSQTLND